MWGGDSAEILVRRAGVGWQQLHVGQQSTTNYLEELLAQRTVILGEPVPTQLKHRTRATYAPLE